VRGRLPLATAFGLVQAQARRNRQEQDHGEFQRVNEATIDPARFRQVLGSYPTGVCVITALDAEGNPAGMVVGTFTSVSLEPPLVGFLPDKTSSSWPKIEQAGHFCVNVLASDQQQLCRQMSAKGTDKFAGVDYTLSANRLPVIAHAIACIECRIHSVTEAGDHWFVLGEVLSMEATREENPMLFHRGRYGGFAEIV
jgi:3-hydroxy-9,10-secoandrosta-1,3,5(10)-triene-9,17-dione monooxygenase reductase component